ncbi:MAG: DUF2062 domain-containing protein [Candidatus Ratteibacteria bacterium]|jgi:uncharacterized protein (DUF2062 family)
MKDFLFKTMRLRNPFRTSELYGKKEKGPFHTKLPNSKQSFLQQYHTEKAKIRKKGIGTILKTTLFSLKNRREAQSFALGVFIGSTPFLGAHTLLSLLTAIVLKRNFLLIFAGSCIPSGTPIQAAITYYFSFKIGRFILAMQNPLPDLHLFKTMKIYHLLSISPKEIVLPFFLGNILIGIILSVAAYLIIFGISHIRKKKR